MALNNPSNNEGYSRGYQAERVLPAPRALNVTPVKIVIAVPIANKESPLSPMLAITETRPAVTKNGNC